MLFSIMYSILDEENVIKKILQLGENHALFITYLRIMNKIADKIVKLI